MTATQAQPDKPTNSQPLVWIVDSQFTGELNARIGLAERLKLGYEIVPPPNGDTDQYAQTLKARYISQHNKPPLLLISGTGEETTAEIADLKSEFNGALFNVYLASILPDNPHPRLAEYNLVASPQLTGDNVVSLIGVPHKLTRENLAAAYLHYQDYFAALPKPIICLLVGGNTRYCDGFDEAHARTLAARVSKIANALGGTIVITNSRRTPAAAQAALLAGLAQHNCHFFDWQQIANGFYHGLLAHADLFIATGDSLSMCSEAAFTGKPLLVDISEQATEACHRDIIGKLIAYGAAKPLGDTFQPWTYQPPDPTGAVASVIKARFRLGD